MTTVNWTSFRAADFRNRQEPPMFLRLSIKPEKTHSVLMLAGEIRVSRHKPASYLISLPQEIVQFTSAMPDPLHSQIFSVGFTGLQIKIVNGYDASNQFNFIRASTAYVS